MGRSGRPPALVVDPLNCARQRESRSAGQRHRARDRVDGRVDDRVDGEVDEELAELVAIGHRLAALKPSVDVEPDPEFRAGLRAMLMAAAEREGIGQTARPESEPTPVASVPGRTRRTRTRGAVSHRGRCTVNKPNAFTMSSGRAGLRKIGAPRTVVTSSGGCVA